MKFERLSEMQDLLENAVLRLNKFDVAERQLLQAIRMFFDEQDEVSIHTLSEAASQVLHDIGKKSGVFSIVRDNDQIRPESRSEWLAAIFSSRNFFKHADRDATKVHEFKAVFNDFSLLDAMNMYTTLKKRWTPETLNFMVWFGLAHPHLVRNDSDLYPVLAKLQANGNEARADNKKHFARVITALREGKLSAPNLDLSYGLPFDDASQETTSS
jgi:hypothetical protein